MPIQMLEWSLVMRFNIWSTMHNSYDVIKIDNYFILNKLQVFQFWEHFICDYPFGLKTCQTQYL